MDRRVFIVASLTPLFAALAPLQVEPKSTMWRLPTNADATVSMDAVWEYYNGTVWVQLVKPTRVNEWVSFSEDIPMKVMNLKPGQRLPFKYEKI